MPQPANEVTLLEQLGSVRVIGADAEGFLQGQLSNDVREASPAGAQPTSFSSPKGRLLAVMNLFRDPDAFRLELHRGVFDSVVKRLRMYVLRSKVKIEDASPETATLALWGPDAAEILQAAGLPAPARPLEAARHAALLIARRPGETPRFTISGPRANVAAAQPALERSARPATAEAWRLLEIEAGLPTIYPETQDHFVAQMCNLDQLGAISFKKGCYTGQEVIARVHYRGSVKRRMQKVRLDTTAPAPGTRIEAPVTGEAVDAATHPEGGSVALVVAQERGT